MLSKANLSSLVPIVANQALALLLGVAALKLTSLVVAPPVYGLYAIFLTLTQIGVLLTHSGLINLTSRQWKSNEHRQPHFTRFVWSRAWKVLPWLTLFLSLLALGLYFAFRDVRWLVVLPMLIVANLALAITEIGAIVLNASERHWAVLGFRTSATAARLFSPLLLIVLIGGGYLTLSVGFALQGLLMILVTALVLRPVGNYPAHGRNDFEDWDRALRTYGRPFIVLGIGGWLLQNADRWIVERFFGIEQAGQFAMGAGLGGFVPMFFAAVLLQAFFPRAFRAADAARSPADWKRLAQKCDFMTAGFLVATVAVLGALALTGPALVGPLVEPRYAPAIEMLFVCGLAMASVQTNQFQFLLLQGQQDSRAMVRVMIVVAIVKTAGSIAAASVSWDLYLYWLGASVLVCAVLGRQLVRRAVFATVSTRVAAAAEPKGE